MWTKVIRFCQLFAFALVATLTAAYGGTLDDSRFVALYDYATEQEGTGEDTDVESDGDALGPVISDLESAPPTFETSLLRAAFGARRSWFDDRITARAPPGW